MPNGNRLLAALAAAALAAPLSACGPKVRNTAPPAMLEFRNESAERAEIYALRPSGGGAMRIGTVEAGRTAQIRVPVSALGADRAVSFRARISGRPRIALTTQVLPLGEGERVAVRLPPDLKLLAVVPPAP